MEKIAQRERIGNEIFPLGNAFWRRVVGADICLVVLGLGLQSDDSSRAAKTRSVFDRHNIVSEEDLGEAARKTWAHAQNLEATSKVKTLKSGEAV